VHNHLSPISICSKDAGKYLIFSISELVVRSKMIYKIELIYKLSFDHKSCIAFLGEA